MWEGEDTLWLCRPPMSLRNGSVCCPQIFPEWMRCEWSVNRVDVWGLLGRVALTLLHRSASWSLHILLHFHTQICVVCAGTNKVDRCIQCSLSHLFWCTWWRAYRLGVLVITRIWARASSISPSPLLTHAWIKISLISQNRGHLSMPTEALHSRWYFVTVNPWDFQFPFLTWTRFNSVGLLMWQIFS